MNIITKQSKVIPGIESFLSNYQHVSGGSSFYNEERFNKISKLVPETCSVEEFETALGFRHWTWNRCDECGEDFEVILHIGDDVDYDARWQCLCAGCLMKAVKVLEDYKGD